jgi:hypothetical protein
MMFVKGNGPTNWYDTPATDDSISRHFISILCNDPWLDNRLCVLCGLFAIALPEMDGGFLHHDGYRQLN